MVTGPHSDAPKTDQPEVLQASPASQCTRGSLGSQEPEAAADELTDGKIMG
jgi:hypothetical protein